MVVRVRRVRVVKCMVVFGEWGCLLERRILMLGDLEMCCGVIVVCLV